MTKVESIREFRREALAKDPARAAGEAALVRLANRVYVLRISMRLTQKDVADRSGLDQASISDIENGDANPTVRTLGRIAAGLGVDAGALLERASLGVRFGSNLILREGAKWQGPSAQKLSITASSSAKGSLWPRLGPHQVKRVTVSTAARPTRRKVGAV